MLIPIPSLFRLILIAVLCTGCYFVGFYQNFRGDISFSAPSESDHAETSTCDFPHLFPPLDFFAHHFINEPMAETARLNNRRMKRYRRIGGTFGGAEAEDERRKYTAAYQNNDLRN